MTATISEYWQLTHAANGSPSTKEWTDAGDTWLDRNATGTAGGGATRVIVQDDKAGVNNFSRALFRFRLPPCTTQPDAPIKGGALILRNDGSGDNITLILSVTAGSEDWIEGSDNNAVSGVAATWTNRDGQNAWTTRAGDEGAFDYTTEAVNGATAAWDSFDLTPSLQRTGLGVGDLMHVTIRRTQEAGNAGKVLYNSMESVTAAASWPDGSILGTSYRPVIRIDYEDAVPTAVTDLAASPSVDDPTRATFEWTPNADADFNNYALRQDTTSPIIGTDTLMNLVEAGGANLMPSAGTSKVTMSQAFTWNANDLLHVRLFVEDGNNDGLDATPSPEIKIIRPNCTTVTNASTGTVPRLFQYSDLSVAPGSLAAQSKLTCAAAGLGDSLTEGGIVWPTRIDVDWGDGLEPTQFVPVVSRISSNVASTDTALTVQNPAGFHIGDVALITNGTNYDIGRVTAVSATTITVDTDLAGYSQGVRYAYTTAANSIVYTVPTHMLAKQFTAANVRARLLNSHGYASDWTATTGSPACAAVNPVAKIDSNRAGIGASGDVIRFAGSQSYSRMADKPITTWTWQGSAGTHGGSAVNASTTVPYWSHTHSFASNCTTTLSVTDGTNTSSTVSLTVTYTAVSNFAISSLVNLYTSRRATYDSGCIVVDGIDAQETVYGPQRLRRVDYNVRASTDTDADTYPDDLEAIVNAIVNAQGITDTLPSSTGGTSVTGKLEGDVEITDVALHVYNISFTVIFPKAT